MTTQHAPTGPTLDLEPGLRCVVAPNPSPMTFTGTNTYLLGTGRIAVIDPGPDDPAHLAALLAAIAERTVSHIFVTHSHRDHSALAPALSAATGAPVLAFGTSEAGRSAVMTRLAAAGLTGGGEGVDARFAPDVLLPDGAEVDGDGWRLRVHHTPGHMGNHVCLQWGDAVFTGDHVMGWASSLVSPPDGDLTDFMASLNRLAPLAARVFYPGHGAPVTDPAARLSALAAHRRDREGQILAALRAGATTVTAITATVYADTPPALHPAAARNVFAHLVDLVGRHEVTTPHLSIDGRFAVI